VPPELEALGEVYRARDTRAWSRRAIKGTSRNSEHAARIPAQRFAPRGTVNLLVSTIRIFALFNDVGQEGETFYLVMEFLTASHSPIALKKGRFRWTSGVAARRSAKRSFEAAHRQGVLHRDLKRACDAGRVAAPSCWISASPSLPTRPVAAATAAEALTAMRPTQAPTEQSKSDRG